MKKLTFGFLLALFLALSVNAQQNIPANGIPDCQIGPVTVATTGRMTIYDNRFTGCTNWTLYEFTNGSASSINIELDEAPDAGGTPGSWAIWPAANRGSATAAYPITSTSQGQASVFTFFPWISVNITTFTGAGANVTYLAIGFRPRFNIDASSLGPLVSSTQQGSINVQSTAAASTPATQETNSIANISCFPASNGGCVPVSVSTFGVDPCQASGVPKLHAFANITTATTTALVAVSGSTAVFICGIDFEISSSTASTVLFEQGTGAACAGSPTAISATYTNATVPLWFHFGHSGATWNKAAASNGLCAVSTVGTGPTIPVDVTYVQQ